MSSRCTTFATVRSTLRTVSRNGHSQALSMCAWPTALTRWADARAGAASTSASSARARAAVPATSWWSRASSARSAARSSSHRRASASGSVRDSPSTTSRSAASAATSRSRSTTSARATRYSGRSSAVRRSPCSVGRKPLGPSSVGFAAASTYSSTCSPGRAGSQEFCGFSPLTTRPSARRASASAWKPGCATSHPRSSTSSGQRASSGTVPVTRNQLVPHAGPQASPTAAGT